MSWCGFDTCDGPPDLLEKERAKVERVLEVLSQNGCDCECGCDSEGHVKSDGHFEEDCEPCLACRIEAAINAKDPTG